MPDDPFTGEDLFAPRVPPQAGVGAPAPPAAVPAGPGPARRRPWMLALTALLILAVSAWVVVLVASPRTPAAPPSPGAPRPPVAATPEPDDAVRSPPGATEAAAALAAAAPTTLRGCAPGPATAPALATLVCPSGTAVVTYASYPDAGTANAAWNAQATGAGGVAGRCGADAAAHTDSYHRGDPARPAGRLLCHQQADGAHLTWTQATRPTVVSSVFLPGGGQAHHEVHDRWTRDEFGPWDAGQPAARVDCADGC